MTTRTFASVAVLFALFVVVVAAQTTNNFQNVGISGSTRISSTQPSVILNESDASADNKQWLIAVEGQSLYLQTCNDALSTCNSIVRLDRSGATAGAANWGVTQHLAPDGSASAPAYSFANDTDTGMYRYAGNSIGFTSGGTLFARYDFAAGYFALEQPLVLTPPGGNLSINAQSSSIAVIAADRLVDDGTVISIRQAGSEEGTIAVSGTTVSYNAFMGSHYTQLKPGQVAPPAGTVVVSTGETIPSRGDGEKFVYVEPSPGRNARGTYGVWFASLNQTAKGMSWGDPSREVFQVAGLGLHPGVLVTDTCGPIRKGDLIASSPVAGVAERQCHPSGANRYDPLVRDTTLGKAVADVDFSKVTPDRDGVKRALVPAVLYAG